MANVLSQFLVGIGWDTSDFDKGTRNIERSMGGVKSSATQLGAVLAGALGFKSLTLGFAKQTDQLNQFAQAINVSAEDVRALGGAFEIAGSSADSALGILQTLTRARDVLETKGEAAFFEDAAFAGLDPQAILSASDSVEALLNIVGEFNQLSAQRQRVLADTLGLDPAGIQLFRQGRESVEDMVLRLRNIRPATEEAAEASRTLNSELSLLGENIGGITQQISTPLVGALGDATAAVNQFIEANRPIIDGAVGKGVKIAEENFAALSLAVGGLAAAGTLGTLAKLSRYVPIIGGGLGTIAANLARLSGIGAAAGTAALVSGVADDILRENLTWYERADEALTRGIYDLTSFDVSRGDVYEGTERRSLNPWAGIETPYGRAVEQSRQEIGRWFGDAETEQSSPWPGVTVNVPEQRQPDVNVNIPEQRQPVLWSEINVPEQRQSDVNVNVPKPVIWTDVEPTARESESPTTDVYRPTQGGYEARDDMWWREETPSPASVQPILLEPQTVVVKESPAEQFRNSQPAQRSYPPVQVTLEMDKRVIAETVVDVNERIATTTLEDITSTTSR